MCYNCDLLVVVQNNFKTHGKCVTIKIKFITFEPVSGDQRKSLHRKVLDVVKWPGQGYNTMIDERGAMVE